MDLQLTNSQLKSRDWARGFAAEQIVPYAASIDQEQRTPDSVLVAIRGSGILGAKLPSQWGGGELDHVSYGLMTEEIGKVCSSIRSLMTVHNMSAEAIVRFGTPDQKSRWMPKLCTGKKIIAFALSEQNVGSSTIGLETTAICQNDSYLLNGTKKWITYGQIADQFLVFAICQQQPLALVVERNFEGVTVRPIEDMLGIRGAMLAEVNFENVLVPKSCQLGSLGSGIQMVANAALDHGRFSVAWGCVGIAQACLDSCVSFALERRQGGHRLLDYQLIRRQLSDMLVAHTSARALCFRSAWMREMRDPKAVMETSMAKYHASDVAVRIATEAVRIHGANGCTSVYPVSRCLRDASVMSIIEGTHEIHQLALAEYALQKPYMD